ncbi:hypothetical protein [Halorussus sp. AFM4]
MTESRFDTASERTGYSDYDPQHGPVYVIEADGDDGEWIQSSDPVDVEP